MKRSNFRVAALGALMFWSMGSLPAVADEVLLDASATMMGVQSFTDTFSVASAGVLTVTLTNQTWLQPLSTLDLLMSDTSRALGAEMTAGTSTFDVAAGMYTAHLFAAAQGPLNTGSYGLKIDFLPSSGTPVPLPTSIALLLSGIGLLIWQRRPRGLTQTRDLQLS